MRRLVILATIMVMAVLVPDSAGAHVVVPDTPPPLVARVTASPCCGAKWQYASWGRAWVAFDGNVAYGEVDDILTDGHCVYVAVRVSGRSWPGVTLANSQSCGPIRTFNSSDYIGASTRLGGVRMYRTGTGNYLTLAGS